jgi:predicted DNA-binding transcriptional regulator YafY
MPENLPENKELFYTVEVLDEAISKNKMVAFNYTEYCIDKKRHRRKDGSGKPYLYEVSPCQMVATNGRYYLICNLRNKESAANYRVDRIVNIQILDEPAKPMREIKGLEHGLDLPRHMAEHIYMFSGESKTVTFRLKKYIISDVVDWFGKDAIIQDNSVDEAIATVRVNEHAMFYWAMQYGEHVEVLEPQSLRERITKTVKQLCEKYSYEA